MTNSTAEHIARQIRARAAATGRSLTECREAAGLSKWQFSRRMKGDPSFRVRELDQIASVLGTTAAALMGGPTLSESVAS